MRFLLDHDVPEYVAALLGHWGHETTVLAEGLAHSATDREVFYYACHHGFILLTSDRRNVTAQAGSVANHPGVIVLQRRRSRAHEHAALFKVIYERPCARGKNSSRVIGGTRSSAAPVFR